MFFSSLHSDFIPDPVNSELEFHDADYKYCS